MHHTAGMSKNWERLRDNCHKKRINGSISQMFQVCQQQEYKGGTSGLVCNQCYNLKVVAEASQKMPMDSVLLEEFRLIQGGLGSGGVADTQTEVMVLQGSWCGFLEQAFCQGQLALDHQRGGVNEAAAEHLAEQFPGRLWAR